jgi:hypothetical protein
VKNGALIAIDWVGLLVLIAVLGPGAELCARIRRALFRRRARR